jgi:hypothetical protein
VPRPRHSGTFANRETATARRKPSPPRCATLWIGEALGPVERACLRSVLRQGHQFDLYCYGAVAGIPDGVQVRDANAVIPDSEIFFSRSGSVAAFSDWFRYELQRRDAGTWLDADVYLLHPLDGEADYLFGEEDPSGINNAVLRIPPDSQLLSMLLEMFETKRVPSWLPWRYYLPGRIGELIHGPGDLTRLAFGSTGPFALTAAAKRLGLQSKALPVEVFNPVAWDKADWILDPAITLDSLITERTVAVHLWNQCIQQFKNSPAPEGSFLARLQREGAG